MAPTVWDRNEFIEPKFTHSIDPVDSVYTMQSQGCANSKEHHPKKHKILKLFELLLMISVFRTREDRKEFSEHGFTRLYDLFQSMCIVNGAL